MFEGAKGGSSKFKQTPDNLRSTDTFEGVLGLCAGPIVGPVRGLKSIKIDGTPIENETGELNFPDFAGVYADGDPLKFPQEVKLQLGAGASPLPVNVALRNDGGSNPVWVTRTLSNTGADFIDMRFIVNALYTQTKKGIFETNATIEIQMKPVGSTNWINPTITTPTANYLEQGQEGFDRVKYLIARWNYREDGQWSNTNKNYNITGKTTGPAVYEARIAVPNEGAYANTAWDVRARLLQRESYSDSDGVNQEKRTVSWESMSAVYSTKYGTHEDWRGLAWLQVTGKASDQLTGVPEITGVYQTKIVQVPPIAIFNPATRVYQPGVWDGSWSQAFTNDPAWVINNAISDAISGLSLIAPGSYLNKWDALEVSKWCSQQVSDGDGGLEPRYSLNLAISDPQNAEEFIRYMAGAVGALAWDNGLGEWRIKIDKPETAVDIFTLDSIDGEFVYSHTDVDTRYNDIIGQFKNKEKDYEMDAVRLFDNPSIANLGRKPTTIPLIGCTGRQEAMRRVKLRLRACANERRIVNFTTNRRGRNIDPLAPILIADGDLDDSSIRSQARIVGISADRKTITVRDAMRLEAGVNYEIQLTSRNPDYAPDTATQPANSSFTSPTLVINRTVTNTSAQRGSVKTIYLSAPLPTTIDANADFSLVATGLPSLPRMYRVISVVPQDDGERVAISAINVDVDKWDAADNVSKDDTVFVDLRGAVPPPTALSGRPLLQLVEVPLEQGTQVNLQAVWVRPPSAFINGFDVRYRINGGAWQPSVRQPSAEWELVGPTVGTYEVEVRTVGRTGELSLPLVGVVDINQQVLGAGDITYDGGETLEELKPAQPGATEGMTDAEKSDAAQLATALALAQAQIATIESSVSADFSEVHDALSSLNGEVDTAQSNISSLQSTTSQLSGNVSTLQGQVSTAQNNIASLQAQAAGLVSDVDGLESQITAQGGQISTLQTTTSTQGGQISTLQTTVSNTSGDVATLKTQINAGGGNLLVNTDFGLDTSGWAFSVSGANGSVPLRNSPSSDYYPPNENTLVTQQNNTTSTGYADWTQTIEVAAGKWYDVSVYAASHRCQIQIYLMWLDSAGAAVGATPSVGPFGHVGGGNTLASFPIRSFKAQAPAGTVRAQLFLRKFGTNSGTTDSWAWFLRPQVVEVLANTATPVAYSPGSARSSISVQATALSSLTTSVSTLSTTVSTQGGSISTLQSSVSTLQGSVSTLQTTVSTQGTNITNLQTAVSTAQGDLATLKTQVTAGGGNLLVNTDLGLDTSGWNFGSTHSASYGRNLPSSALYPPYENTLTIVQGNNTTTGNSDLNQTIEVTEGKWYDLSCYCASHRCQTAIYIQWLDSSGNASFGAPSTAAIGPIGGGSTLGSFTIRSVKAQAPTGAVRARIILRKFGTISGEADSYAWFLRPQVVEVLANTATPVAYSPGSSRASIVTQATALSTLSTSFSSLSTTVSTQGGSISTLQSSMTTAQGNISTLQTTVSTQGGQISTLQSTSSTQAGQISTLQSTVSTQGGSISTMQSTLTTLQGTVSTLNTVVTASSNPNIVQNGGFENGFTGWTGGGVNAGNWSVQNWVWGYWASNSGWTGATNNNFAYIDSTHFGVAGAGNYVTQSFDVDFQGGAGCVAYGSIVWLNSSGGAISTTRGPDIAPRTFDATGNSRAKITHVAPSGAETAICRIVFVAPNGAVMSAINVRHVKVEFGSVATPYSGEATAGQMYQAYSTLNTSFASLSTTVSSQGGSISTLQSSYTSLNGTVSTLSSTVSAQGSSISTLQSASSTQAGQISTLQTQVNAGGSNLIQNSQIASLDGWVQGGNQLGGVTFSINGQPAEYRVAGQNNLCIYQSTNSTTGYQEFRTEDATGSLAVEAGKYYDVSVRYGAHRCTVTVYLQWINASGGSDLGAPNVSGGTNASGTGLSQWGLLSFKVQAPAGAVRARLILRKFATLSGNSDSWAWFMRPQVAETLSTSASPLAYSPGGSFATAVQQASAISSLTSQQATLSSTVSTQGGSISTLQSSMSTAQGDISTLQTTVSAQGTSISTLQTAVSTAQGDVATLKTRITAGGGNLLVNTDAAVDISGWSTGGTMTTGVSFGINIAGDAWRPVPDNILGIQQANTTSSGYHQYIQLVAVQANKWYYASVYAASHRSTTALYVQFLNSSGNVTGAGISASDSGAGAGGNTLAAYALMSGKAQAPADAVSARFFLRKFSTLSGQTPDSYAWFCRPQLAETTADATTPPAYSPGSARASIQVQASALSTLTSQYSSLNSTVSTLNSTVNVQQTAINNLNGKTAAYWQVEAVAGGRAQLKVYADANGGAGVDIIGDLRVSGNGIFAGTINPEALDLSRFVKRISGSGGGMPAAGQSLLLYAQDIGVTSANGSYLIELTGGFQTSVGRQTGNYNSKPFYTNHVPDGGLQIVVMKNGVSIGGAYFQGSEFINTTNVGLKQVSVNRNLVIDSPGGGDSSSGNAAILIYAIRGNSDTGIVNQGEYYQQDVSASYVNFSIAAKTKWTFI